MIELWKILYQFGKESLTQEVFPIGFVKSTFHNGLLCTASGCCTVTVVELFILFVILR